MNYIASKTKLRFEIVSKYQDDDKREIAILLKKYETLIRQEIQARIKKTLNDI